MTDHTELIALLRKCADDIEAIKDEDSVERFAAWGSAVSAQLGLGEFTDGGKTLRQLGFDPDEVIAVADVMLRKYTGLDTDGGSPDELRWFDQRDAILAGMSKKKIAAVEAFVREGMDKERVEGASFRGFIYGILDLPTSAYVPLFCAGGMEFTNACPEGRDIEGVQGKRPRA